MNNFRHPLLVLTEVTETPLSSELVAMTTEAFCDALRCLFEYRVLLGRREILRLALGDTDAARLDQLGRLWQWRPEDRGGTAVPPPQSRRFARCDVHMGAELRVRGVEEPVTIVNLGGGGVVVTGMPPLRPGELVLLKVRLPALGREYQFPAQARWRSEGFGAQAARVALAFVATPLELRFGPGRSALTSEAA
jgi:hypothetical protein